MCSCSSRKSALASTRPQKTSRRIETRAPARKVSEPFMSREITKASKSGAAKSAPRVASESAEPGPALDFGRAWEYAPAPESADHVKLAARYELFIGGAWRAPKSKRYFATISPSTEKPLAE